MARSKYIGRNKRKDQDPIIEDAPVLNTTQDFFERNQKQVLIALAALVIIVGGYLGYKYLIQAPKNAAAMESIYKAQDQFQRDSFALALENPGGGFDGFLDIIDKYSGTKVGNLANYYAGISYLNLGKYEAAIEYLNDFSPSDDVTPIMKDGALGDAYSELGEYDKAISKYKSAANDSENEFLSPYYLKKLGLLLSKQGDNSGAVAAFKTIKEKYPNSTEGRDIDRFIERYSEG